MTADNLIVTGTWVDKVEKRTESDRLLDGKLSVDDFGWLHLPCGKVERVDLPPVNSGEVDPASGDLKPIYGYKLHCSRHNVSSAVETL